MSPTVMVEKIVSGGQTGADRAALDWARARGLPHGGWCPRGRRAEDGRLAPDYELTETDSHGYRQRTRLNVRDSDGTLVVNLGSLAGGTALTAQMARYEGRPCLVLQLDDGVMAPVAQTLREWLAAQEIRVLNVAGPRGSKSPDIYSLTRGLLDRALGAQGSEERV